MCWNILSHYVILLYVGHRSALLYKKFPLVSITQPARIQNYALELTEIQMK